jgi:hypothetical protein
MGTGDEKMVMSTGDASRLHITTFHHYFPSPFIITICPGIGEVACA